MHQLAFSKYTGCGNDFIVLDGRRSPLPPLSGEQIVNLCNRQYGIGSDGVLVIEESDQALAKMRVFNPDGREAKMCGNGLRCVGKFLLDHSKETLNRFTLEVSEQLFEVERVEEGLIQVTLPPPTRIALNQTLPLPGCDLPYHFVDTGVPHVVTFVDEIESVDPNSFAPSIRHHEQFAPEGTNVTWAQLSARSVSYRTYERGVEGETLACGTGGAAVATALYLTQKNTSPISVTTRSGESLLFEIERSPEGTLSGLKMCGPAWETFTGVVQIAFNQPSS